MNETPSWRHRSEQRAKTSAFEVRVEIGCDDPEAARALMAAIGQVVQTQAPRMFPTIATPLPCKGCGDGPK